MPCIKYINKRIGRTRLELVDKINSIIDDYKAQGLSLTLRQVYYRLVAADIIPNTERNYKNIGNLINDARLLGLMDWNSIEDRTRNLAGRRVYDGPTDFITSVIEDFHLDYWKGQDQYVEIWVEKDALKNIVGNACYDLDVNYFSCRGYVSQSEMWTAAQRLRYYGRGGRAITLLHFGDHDPSGIDMSRDIVARMEMFGVNNLEFRRMALNMDQIELYNPPPNPAKITDSRYEAYTAEYGFGSWELDALEPKVIHDLIQNTVRTYRDETVYRKVKREEEMQTALLTDIADHWFELQKYWRDFKEDYVNE